MLKRSFWERASVVVPEESREEQDLIATFKVAGLHRVVEHVGAWSLYDVSDMIDLIDKMLGVQGGEGTEFMKKFLLSDSIKALSTSSFMEASRGLQGKLDEMTAGSDNSELKIMFQMQNSNTKIWTYL